MLATDLKRKAVSLAGEKGPRYSSMFYKVPLKSLKRWMKVGCERKKGGGRKTKDPQMERALYKWYKNEIKEGKQVTARRVKEMAIQMSSCGDFIASKGWLDKFKVRFRLEICKETNNVAHVKTKEESSEEPPEQTLGSDSDLVETDEQGGTS